VTKIELPDVLDLRLANELGALALLEAALVVADQSLRLEHAEIDGLRDADPQSMPEGVALLASLLSERFRELRSLLGAYAVGVRRSAFPSEIPY
jgi:hypothetical protein